MRRREVLRMIFVGGSALLSERCGAPPQPSGSKRVIPSTLIRGGRIVTAEKEWEADIRIGDGKIVEMDTGLEPGGSAQRVIDAGGLEVLPGGIDPHTHLCPPWVDDYTSGSQAALAGGITTIGSMVRVREGERLPEALERETDRVSKEAIADIVLHPILSVPHDPRELSKIVDAGHRSIKIFMISDRFVDNEAAYREIIEEAGRLGILTLLHCEDAAIIDRAEAELVAAGHASLRYYAESRPVESEVVATRQAVAICEQTGKAPIYVVHLSCKEALDVCRSARSRGLPVYVETRPIYLHFTKERYLEPDGPLFVGQPPLRDGDDVEALWKGLEDGSIDTLGTDHAPWTREQKLDPGLDVTRLRPGVANLQTMLPVLYSEGVLSKKISLSRFVAVTSTNAAKLLGLYPAKGTIEVGSDADIVLWDPSETKTVRREDLFSRAGFSLFEGMRITGWPQVVLRRGEVVYDKGQILARAGSGRVPRRGPVQKPAAAS
jgi:dihydropyrimidinase